VLHVGFEGMSCPEVGARLGLPAETVKKRWQRLRARLETAGLPRLLLEA
jgi:DNA-directed RNA polymerase specialized sigma24 family protein